MSENIQFAKRCEEEGIIFIGPKSKHLDMFGDKSKSKNTSAASTNSSYSW
ncbi:biotin carboxylase N-terminal domain-containing protein [Bacillus pacificus]